MYGTSAKVAVKIPHVANRLTENPTTYDFSDTTKVQKVTVEAWLDDVSNALDACLSQQGFETPVTTPDRAVQLIASFATEIVARMVRNSITNLSAGPVNDMALGALSQVKLVEECCKYISEIADALESWGLSRNRSLFDHAAWATTEGPIFTDNNIRPTYMASMGKK